MVKATKSPYDEPLKKIKCVALKNSAFNSLCYLHEQCKRNRKKRHLI